MRGCDEIILVKDQMLKEYNTACMRILLLESAKGTPVSFADTCHGDGKGPGTAGFCQASNWAYR